jgi:hypothetical protein
MAETVRTLLETETITVTDEGAFVSADGEISTDVNVVEEEKVLITEEAEIQLFTVAEQGPPGPAGLGVQGDTGPPGPQGVPGNSTTLNLLLYHFNAPIMVTPFQPIDLGNLPLTNSLGIYINGLIQYSNDYELTGSIVTLKPSSLLQAGDVLTIRYSYTTEV